MTGKYSRIELVDVLGNCIRRQGFADDILHFGQCRMVAIGRTAGSVGKTAHLGITRRHQHVQEAIDIGGVAGDRIVEATRHRAERGLMEHVVDTLAGATAVFQTPNVALNEAEARPLLGTDQALHLVKVALVAGGEVVQPDHALVELEQGFEQVGADEAGYAGNEPGLRVLGEVDAELVVAGHGVGAAWWFCCRSGASREVLWGGWGGRWRL